MPELAVSHASDTEEVSKVIVPDADVYEEEAVELMEDARQAPDSPVPGH